jgi:hypothetical protein
VGGQGNRFFGAAHDIRFTESLPNPQRQNWAACRELATHGEIKATPPRSKISR